MLIFRLLKTNCTIFTMYMLSPRSRSISSYQDKVIEHEVGKWCVQTALQCSSEQLQHTNSSQPDTNTSAYCGSRVVLHVLTGTTSRIWASQVALVVKNPPAMQETWVQSLGWEDPLEKGMATHSSILAWRIPWTEEPGGLQSMGLQRVGPDWVTELNWTETSYALVLICY